MQLYTDEMSSKERVLAAGWLSERIGQAFPVEILPEKGVAVFNEKKVLCVATLYVDRGSPVAVCGFCVTNPENSRKESYRSVKLALSMMSIYATRFEVKYVLTLFGNRGINRILERMGYEKGESAETRFKVTG